jgi:uncharacterized protein
MRTCMNSGTHATGNSLRILTIPGLYGSDTRHWQTRWEDLHGFTRVEQKNWNDPDYDQWAQCLLNYVDNCTSKSEFVLVAHSLGCHLVAKIFPLIKNYIEAVLFVAPPDLNSGVIKKDLSSFAVRHYHPLGVPGYLVYSENDPYADTDYSVRFGKQLGLLYISVGNRGHINSESHLGNWDEGFLFLDRLLDSIRTEKPACGNNNCRGCNCTT